MAVCGSNFDASFENIDIYTSLFQQDLLRTHELHVKEELAAVFQREYMLSLRDERSTLRIHCFDMAINLPGTAHIKFLVLVYTQIYRILRVRL